MLEWTDEEVAAAVVEAELLSVSARRLARSGRTGAAEQVRSPTRRALRIDTERGSLRNARRQSQQREVERQSEITHLALQLEETGSGVADGRLDETWVGALAQLVGLGCEVA